MGGDSEELQSLRERSSAPRAEWLLPPGAPPKSTRRPLTHLPEFSPTVCRMGCTDRIMSTKPSGDLAQWHVCYASIARSLSPGLIQRRLSRNAA